MKFAEILQLKLDEQDAEIRRKTKLKEAAKVATDKYKDSTPELGKLYAALDVRRTRGQRTLDDHGKPCTPTFSQSLTLSDLIEQITKAKAIGRAYQCMNAFSYWVGTDGSGPVSEDKYDGLPSNVLETAGAIARCLGMDLARAERDEVASLLNSYDKNTTANLKAIKSRLDPADPMDTEKADEHVKKLAENGNLFVVIGAIARHSPGAMAEVLAHFVPDLNSVEGKRVFFGLTRANYHFETSVNAKNERIFSDETIQEWSEEIRAILDPPKVEVKTAPVLTGAAFSAPAVEVHAEAPAEAVAA